MLERRRDSLLQTSGRPQPRPMMTHWRPTLVSVRSFTLSPWLARCRVSGVDSFIPRKSLGEKTSNGSDTVSHNSCRPLLYCQRGPDRGFKTHSAVRNSENFNRKMPGMRTLSLAKMHNSAERPSSNFSFSGVCITSPAAASTPAAVLTGTYEAPA